MTDNTIAAKLIAKSAERKNSQSEAFDCKPDPGQRILDTFKRSTEKELLKEQKLNLGRDKAIVANLANALEVLEEGILRDFFVALEGSASASQRKLIETHPLRSDEVAALVAEVDAARAEETEKAKAQREAERLEKEREQFERLRQKFEPNDAKTPAPAEDKSKD